MKSKFKDREHSENDKLISQLVQELWDGGIVTLKQLDEMVDAGWDAFLHYESDNPPVVDGKEGVFLDVGVVRVLCSIASDRFRRVRKESADSLRKYEEYRGYVRKKF